MSLAVILVTIAIEHFLGALQGIRRLGWFHIFVDWLWERISGYRVCDGPLGVLITMALPLLGFWVLYGVVSGVSPYVAFLASVAVLLYSIGPKDLNSEINSYLEACAEHAEEQVARLAAELTGSRDPVTPRSREQQVCGTLFVAANDRLFAVLFWFVVLGPLGALWFRLSSELRRHRRNGSSGFARSVVDLYDILVWVPARLVALGYALSGSFTHAIEAWRFRDTVALGDSAVVLVQSGMGALQLGNEPELSSNAEELAREIRSLNAVRTLIKHTLLIWLAVLAVITFAGWAS
jgi:membrane protein required for beta-lactamase induction